jgi:hypothetical protein
MIKNRFFNTLPCKIFNSVTLIIVKSMWYITFVSYNDSFNFSDDSIPGRKLLLFGQLGSEPTRCRLVFFEMHVVRTKADIFDYITSLKYVKKLKKVFYYLIHLLCYIVWLNIYLTRYFSDNVVVRFILSLLEYDYSQ